MKATKEEHNTTLLSMKLTCNLTSKVRLDLLNLGNGRLCITLRTEKIVNA